MQTIDTAFVRQYGTGIEMLVQQMTAKLRGSVDEDTIGGERKGFDQVGTARLTEKTTRDADMPKADVPLKKRWISPRDYWGREFVDSFDKLKVLNDPTNAISQAFAGAAARLVDKVIVDAAFGTAYEGKEGTTPVTLPPAQKIAAGGTGFTLAKLKKGVRILKTANAIMPGDTINVGWTAKQEEEFIDTNEVKSSDFVNFKVYEEGGVDVFYKVKFHLIEDVEDNAAGRQLPKTTTVRSCPMWVRSGLKFAQAKLDTPIDWLPEKQVWQVACVLSCGAVRMQEKKVVQIDVEEPA